MATHAQASIGHVAFFVDVKAVLTRRKSRNRHFDQHRFTATILRKRYVSKHTIWPVNYRNRFQWFGVLKRIEAKPEAKKEQNRLVN